MTYSSENQLIFLQFRCSDVKENYTPARSSSCLKSPAQLIAENYNFITQKNSKRAVHERMGLVPQLKWNPAQSWSSLRVQIWLLRVCMPILQRLWPVPVKRPPINQSTIRKVSSTERLSYAYQTFSKNELIVSDCLLKCGVLENWSSCAGIPRIHWIQFNI